MAEKGSKFPVYAIVAAALVAGALAGGLGLYVTGGPSGNMIASAPEPGDASCTVEEGVKAAVDEAIGGEVAAMLLADPPQDLSPLSFDDPDGRPMTLADLSGKTLLVNLWATWCAPCREEMPALDALQAEMGGEEFEVLPVSLDRGDAEKPRKFLEETGIENLGLYRDPKNEIFNTLKRRGQAFGLPTTLLVDRDGCEIGHLPGPADWASDDAKALIETALGGGSSG